MSNVAVRVRTGAGFAIRIGLLVAALAAAALAQKVDSLSQVKTVYVAQFAGGSEAGHLRDSFLRRLQKGPFQFVEARESADAVVTGTGQVWIRGYVTTNSRTPAAGRRAVYSGYLSIEVADAHGQPLWSWLETPGKLTWTNVVDDLSGHAAKRLIDAASAKVAATAHAVASSPLAATSLTGGGATFPAPLYQRWFEAFELLHPGVHLRYIPLGSQAGDQKLVAGELDFAGSDVVPEAVVDAAQASHLRRFAAVLGAVVPIYNLSGVTQDLRFTPEALADIYLGRVQRWDDEEIRRPNRDANLPTAAITVIHRSDGSGTTWVWSDFLSKSSRAWSGQAGKGTSLAWPVGTGAEGNEGVAEAVMKTPNSIGYVELTYAIQHQLSFGAVRNPAGEFVRADLETLVEAAKSAELTDATSVPILNSQARYAYPITAFTWLVVPLDIPEPSKRAALTELLRWVLTSGQKECSALGYVPLPREIIDRELRMLGQSP